MDLARQRVSAHIMYGAANIVESRLILNDFSSWFAERLFTGDLGLSEGCARMQLNLNDFCCDTQIFTLDFLGVKYHDRDGNEKATSIRPFAANQIATAETRNRA